MRSYFAVEINAGIDLYIGSLFLGEKMETMLFSGDKPFDIGAVAQNDENTEDNTQNGKFQRLG